MTHFITLQNHTAGARRLKIERGGFTGYGLRRKGSLRIWEQDSIITHDEDGQRIDLSSDDIEAIATAMETAGWHRVLCATLQKEI